MGEYVIKLPDVGEGVAEAEVVEWHVHVGEAISEDDVLAEVMTDKATVELPSPVDGVVRWLGAEVGDIVAVGAELVKIETDGAARAESTDPAAEAPPATEAGAGTDGSGTAVAPVTAPPRPEPAAQGHRTERPTAAPAVRARAQRLGLDLAGIPGTGPDGRVLHEDLDAVLTRSAAPIVAPPTTAGVQPSPTGDAVESIKVTGLRRNIAERMQASKRRIPHFTYVEEVDVTALEALRAEMNAARADGQPKLSVLPYLMRAVVRAVGAHPEMNARFDDESGVVERHRAVHLGIAVQTARGLMVPVVKQADGRDIWDCAVEVARLSEAARTAKVTLQELSGSTITITSLGALGGVVTTPVINAPEVAIVGVNKIVPRPVYIDSVLQRRQVMNLSSSFDHRVVDGADAAAFVQTIRRLLEAPALIFV